MTQPASRPDQDSAKAEPPGQPEQPEQPEPAPPIVTVVLVRHGRSTSNVAGTLAGRTPGVELDEQGREQADTLARRLREISIDRLVSSPLQRCRQTLAPLAAALDLPVEIDEQLLEVDYGAWSGRRLLRTAARAALAGGAGPPVGRGVPAGRGPGRDVDPGGRRDPPHPAVGDP